MQKRAGRPIGSMLLFFGCRAPEQDFLYLNDVNGELKGWVEEGIVDVHPAFSRKPESSVGCKYVQE
jgi:cytochrome P450 / NADPH-cytochrome P450 reductase